jgi:hypothetical protein
MDRTQSLSEWARELRITVSGLMHRLKRWPLSEALSLPVQRSKPKGKPVARFFLYKDQLLHVRVIATEIGMEVETLARRLKAGWTIEQAVTTPVRDNKRGRAMLLAHDGRTLSSSDWSRLTGIGEKTIRTRLILGWTIDDALTIPASKSNRYYCATELKRAIIAAYHDTPPVVDDLHA